MKVYSPNENYTGVSASVPFCGGIGETDDPYLIKWFQSHGYRIEQVAEEQFVEEQTAKKTTKVTKKAGE